MKPARVECMEKIVQNEWIIFGCSDCRVSRCISRRRRRRRRRGSLYVLNKNGTDLNILLIHWWWQFNHWETADNRFTSIGRDCPSGATSSGRCVFVFMAKFFGTVVVVVCGKDSVLIFFPAETSSRSCRLDQQNSGCPFKKIIIYLTGLSNFRNFRHGIQTFGRYNGNIHN